MNNAIDFWENLIDMIEEEGRKISRLGFDTWVMTIKPYSYENDTLVLSVPMQINRDMINNRYINLIQNAGDILNKGKLDIKIELEDDLENNNYEEKEFTPDESFYSKTGIVKRYTFDNFVIGESNRFAWAAASAVANAPGTCYNPLFLYGYVGLGKTHLMHAIGNEIIKSFPDKKVLYTTSEDFVISVINAIRDNTISELRDKYRTLDVLMIDDIQFIAGKERCQEEFFHTFNHLYQSGKHIIISSDRLPNEITKLDDRIRSRLIEGLTCDIKQPDYETRVAILKKKIQNDNLDIPDDIISMIAEKVKANIRELEGVLIKIGAYSSLTDRKATKDMVSDIITEITGASKPKKAMNADTVIYEVAKYFDIDPKILKSSSRKKEIAEIRQICMYVLSELTDISLSKIGDALGGRDHTTVLYGATKVSEKMKEDEAYKNKIEDLLSTVGDIF